MKLFPKKVYRELKRSVDVAPGQDRPINGFAYTVIPNDIDRGDYIKLIHQTGYIMVITSDREIFRDVKVPNHLIDSLIFPEQPGEYGQLVSWSVAKQHNQLFITGIYTKPGQFHPYLENIHVTRFPSKSHEITVSADGNAPAYIISVRDNGQGNGSLILKSHSQSGVSQITLDANGVGMFEFDDTLITSVEKRLDIEVGQQIKLVIEKDTGLTYSDGFGNSVVMTEGDITISDDLNNSVSLKRGELSVKSDSLDILEKQIVVNDQTITIAQGTSPLVLGDKITTLLGKLITQIALITVIAPTTGGPTSPPINSSIITALSGELQDLLSQTVFTK
jgi:hypothetical protein